MTGTCPLLDPDGSKRAAMAASLEYGTHPIVGQHLYRKTRTCGNCGHPAIGPCVPCGERQEVAS